MVFLPYLMIYVHIWLYNHIYILHINILHIDILILSALVLEMGKWPNDLFQPKQKNFHAKLFIQRFQEISFFCVLYE